MRRLHEEGFTLLQHMRKGFFQDTFHRYERHPLARVLLEAMQALKQTLLRGVFFGDGTGLDVVFLLTRAARSLGKEKDGDFSMM